MGISKNFSKIEELEKFEGNYLLLSKLILVQRRKITLDMSFGKYKDKAVAWVLFTHPNYFSWMQRNGMTSKKEYQFMLELVKNFNAKPFIKLGVVGLVRERIHRLGYLFTKVFSIWNFGFVMNVTHIHKGLFLVL